jgi:hypothetical protein
MTQEEQTERGVGAIESGARESMKDRMIIHPFLFAIYPLLLLYAPNVEDIWVKHVLKAMLCSVLLTWALFAVLSLLLKSKVKVGLLISAASLLFFSYGHVYESLFGNNNFQTERHMILLTVWGLLFFLYAVWVRRLNEKVKTLTKFFNLFSVLVVLAVTVKILLAFNSYRNVDATAFELTGPGSEVMNIKAAGEKSDPDIYYIILDGYASAATLSGVYNYRDNELVGFLEENGFYVASDSAANYSYTFLSLASSLNGSHLLRLSEKMGTTSTVKKIPFQMVENNTVVGLLKRRGYTYIHYGSRYELTYRNRLADLNINCNPEMLHHYYGLLTRVTLLSALDPLLPYNWLSDISTESKKSLCAFTEASTALNVPGPKFVFMHVLLPHPPWFLRKNGELWTERMLLDVTYLWDRDKYLEQLIFLNGKVKELIGKILSSSSKTPVIILQSDHGPSSINMNNHPDLALKERMTILNAYLLPEGGQKALYQTITPVNSFRVVFNHYFGAKIELLEDKSYFSTWGQPYKFVDVTERVRSGRKAVDQRAGAVDLSPK